MVCCSPAVLLVLLAAACPRKREDTLPDTASSDTSAPDTSTTEPPVPPAVRGCHDDGSPLLPAPTPYGTTALRYRVVQIPSTVVDPAWVVMYYPQDPETRTWHEGAAVVVAARASITAPAAMTPQLHEDAGAIEIQPLYAGWSTDGFTTGGTLDHGGDVDAALVRDALRFAAGLTVSASGHTVGQLAGRPVCNARVPLLAASSAGPLGVRTLAGLEPDLAEEVLGVAFYESPHVPQAVTGDLGSACLDPDTETDADGDGCTWDDGRNHSYTAGACAGTSCTLDYARIAWDPSLHARDLCSYFTAMERPGVLFLDNDGNGLVSLGPGGTPDLDGDGAIGPDEDFLLLPLWNTADALEYFSPEATAAAMERLGAAAWPHALATPEASTAFWASRNAMAHVPAAVGASPPDLSVVTVFTERDHGVLQPTRPHIHALYEAFRAAGVHTRYNVDADLFTCMVPASTRGAWAGPLEAGVALAEQEIQAWAIPETVLAQTARTLAPLGILWDAWGPFDHCPHGGETDTASP